MNRNNIQRSRVGRAHSSVLSLGKKGQNLNKTYAYIHAKSDFPIFMNAARWYGWGFAHK